MLDVLPCMIAQMRHHTLRIQSSCAPCLAVCLYALQGNSLCRGYIHKYNDPPVANFLSVHGTVSGVAGFPKCNPEGLLGPVCKQLADLCGDLAYNEVTQNILFQVDYYRDPLRVNTSEYKEFSQIAQWNNEGNTVNQVGRFLKKLGFAEGQLVRHFGSSDILLPFLRIKCSTLDIQGQLRVRQAFRHDQGRARHHDLPERR